MLPLPRGEFGNARRRMLTDARDCDAARPLRKATSNAVRTSAVRTLYARHDAFRFRRGLPPPPGVSKGAVSKCVQQALQKGLGWPLPANLDEAQLEARMFSQGTFDERENKVKGLPTGPGESAPSIWVRGKRACTSMPGNLWPRRDRSRQPAVLPCYKADSSRGFRPASLPPTSSATLRWSSWR
jgi:hypothetical protein